RENKECQKTFNKSLKFKGMPTDGIILNFIVVHRLILINLTYTVYILFKPSNGQVKSAFLPKS
ncbi:MAG: hypothetical protein ACOCQ4_02680, partial [bacterium]